MLFQVSMMVSPDEACVSARDGSYAVATLESSARAHAEHRSIESLFPMLNSADPSI